MHHLMRQHEAWAIAREAREGRFRSIDLKVDAASDAKHVSRDFRES
jgi:hypothetical protein